MKISTFMLLFIYFAICYLSPYSRAEECDRLAYSGTIYPYFQIVNSNQVLCTGYDNYGSLLYSKNSIYCLDLDQMSIEKLFSVRNTSSKIFLANNTLYFTYPDSLIDSRLTYGPHAWYSAEIGRVNRKRHWTILCKNDSETSQWTTYFLTIDGIYCLVKPNNRYGYNELYKYQDNEYIPAFNIDAAKLHFGHSYIIIDTEDRFKSSFIQIYDIVGKRIVNLPYESSILPEVLIIADKIYYTMDNSVLCYTMNAGTVNTVYKSTTDKYLSLCYNNSVLYVIEDIDNNSKVVNMFSASDNRFLENIYIPSKFCIYENYIIVDNMLFSGNSYTDEIVVFDLNSKTGWTMQLN